MFGWANIFSIHSLSFSFSHACIISLTRLSNTKKMSNDCICLFKIKRMKYKYGIPYFDTDAKVNNSQIKLKYT